MVSIMVAVLHICPLFKGEVYGYTCKGDNCIKMFLPLLSTQINRKNLLPGEQIPSFWSRPLFWRGSMYKKAVLSPFVKTAAYLWKAYTYTTFLPKGSVTQWDPAPISDEIYWPVYLQQTPVIDNNKIKTTTLIKTVYYTWPKRLSFILSKQSPPITISPMERLSFILSMQCPTITISSRERL